MQAEAELKKGGGLFGGLFGGGTERYENAAEKFQRAGHAYKASKNWAGAAATYVKAADAFKKAKSDGDVANCYIEGARCYIKAGDSKTATDLIENEALPRMVDAGRLSQAAKLHEEVAGMLEEGDSEFRLKDSYFHDFHSNFLFIYSFFSFFSLAFYSTFLFYFHLFLS